MKDKSGWPCEKARSTAVDVAIGSKVSKGAIAINILFTRNAEIVQIHAIKVRVNMTVSNPPLQRILNVFNWFAQIFINLTCLKSDILGH